MKYLKKYNENKDFFPGVPKEEVVKKVMEQKPTNRWLYIMDNELADVFTEDEQEKFSDEMIYVDYSDYKLMYAEVKNKRYYVVRIDEEDKMYIFDDDWNKIVGDDYDNIKEAVERYKLRLE